MYLYVLYLISAVFLLSAAYKANHHRAEWIVLLLIMSFVKTCITYLFQASTIFTIFTIGGTQIHLDDIVLIWLFLYCIIYMIRNGVIVNSYFGCQLLLLVPLAISLLRGVVNGTIGNAEFLSDTRKFIFFIVALMAVYFVFGSWETYQRREKIQLYIDRLMNVIIVYTLIVWTLDLVFGVNSLAGQYGGTLSDGGSTMRIINPPQVLMIAFYTLWQLSSDLEKRGSIRIRTFVLIFITVLLQWRTVVAAFAVGIVIVMLGHYISGRSISVKPIFQVIGVGVIGFLISSLSSGGVVFDSITNLFSSYSSMSSDTGTFSTRVEVWNMLLNSLQGINKWIGNPFGSANSSSVTWTHSAHSGYVEYIMVAGYIGCACLIAFMIFILVRAMSRKNVLLASLIVSLMVYWYGYGFSVEQGALLGLILAILESYEIWTGQDSEESLPTNGVNFV